MFLLYGGVHGAQRSDSIAISFGLYKHDLADTNYDCNALLRKAESPVEEARSIRLMTAYYILLVIIIIQLIIIYINIRNTKSDINSILYNIYKSIDMTNSRNNHINTNIENVLNDIERLVKYQKQNEANLGSIFRMLRNLSTKKNKTDKKLKTAEKLK